MAQRDQLIRAAPIQVLVELLTAEAAAGSESFAGMLAEGAHPARMIQSLQDLRCLVAQVRAGAVQCGDEMVQPSDVAQLGEGLGGIQPLSKWRLASRS